MPVRAEGYATGLAVITPSRAESYTDSNYGYMYAGPRFANEGKWIVTERYFSAFAFDVWYLDDGTTSTRDLLAFVTKRAVCKANNDGKQDCYTSDQGGQVFQDQ